MVILSEKIIIFRVYNGKILGVGKSGRWVSIGCMESSLG